MRRNGTCRACGAQVIHTHLAEGDREDVLTLDYFESASGPGRYAIWDDGLARAVSARFQGLAHTVHVCPARSKR